MKVKNSNIIIKEWRVRSKSNNDKYHTVGWNGKDYWVCDCTAGMYGRDCRHKRIVRNKLEGLKKKTYGETN